MTTVPKTIVVTDELERDTRAEALRLALIEDERSGEQEPFDFAAFTCRKVAQHGG